jgi:hypothetical protein
MPKNESQERAIQERQAEIMKQDQNRSSQAARQDAEREAAKDSKGK